MAVNTTSMGLVFFPSTCVHVTISVDESSLSVSLIVGPVSFVHRAIRPGLSSSALSDLSAH
jgi:hypothetical protein